MLVHDGTEPDLYLNGARPSQSFTVQTNKSAWNADISGLDRFTVGAVVSNGSELSQFDGHIDEVMVTSEVLTGADAALIYANNGTLDMSTFNPVSWYRMGDDDGGTGSTITDQGSGSNNGTLNNSPTFTTDVP
jgi:hypothetical protein